MFLVHLFGVLLLVREMFNLTRHVHCMLQNQRNCTVTCNVSFHNILSTCVIASSFIYRHLSIVAFDLFLIVAVVVVRQHVFPLIIIGHGDGHLIVINYVIQLITLQHEHEK